MRHRIVSAYRSSGLPAHVFPVGDMVQPEKRDEQFPEWWWCVRNDGASAWIHESYLELGTRSARVLRWYTNRELTVDAGTWVEEIERCGGWVLVEQDGKLGWILETSL